METPFSSGDVRSPKKVSGNNDAFLNNQYQSVPHVIFGNGIANMTATIWSLQKAQAIGILNTLHTNMHAPLRPLQLWRFVLLLSAGSSECTPQQIVSFSHSALLLQGTSSTERKGFEETCTNALHGRRDPL